MSRLARRLSIRRRFRRALSILSGSNRPRTSPQRISLPIRRRRWSRHRQILSGPIRRYGSPNTWVHNREPRTDASYFDRLCCYLLNKLQEPLEPKAGKSMGFFRFETPLPISLYSYVGSVYFDAAVRVGLDAHTYIRHIDIDITAHKRRTLSEDIIYALNAQAVCFDMNEEAVEVFLDDELMVASVTAEWMNDEGTSQKDESENMWDRLTFDRALLLLRRASKKKYNSFGQMRTAQEAESSPILAGSLNLWGLMPGQVAAPSTYQDAAGMEERRLEALVDAHLSLSDS
ncbi:hypothetical protein BKA65DRAFT_552125 [Rhexocercosporidium sp. MPI-PUGE-AT-0058]|nr:hypothetical protein BKA65DRAFT_552125 [Rhexocercosporidium sp. MPI-PUGE-AT-0058]